MTSDETVLMDNLREAQREFDLARSDAASLMRWARKRRAGAVRAALIGGVSLRVAAEATGLSHMRIAQIRDGE